MIDGDHGVEDRAVKRGRDVGRHRRGGLLRDLLKNETGLAVERDQGAMLQIDHETRRAEKRDDDQNGHRGAVNPQSHGRRPAAPPAGPARR